MTIGQVSHPAASTPAAAAAAAAEGEEACLTVAKIPL